jgi:DNA-binding NarL/FixJ family response regulator
MGARKGDARETTSEASSKRVVIADPSPEMRRAVRDVLQGQPGLVVAASAADGIATFELITYYRPDVAVIELDLPGVDGLELIPRIATAAPDVSVLVFSGRDDEATQLETFRVGASGFVSKQAGPQAIANATRGLLRGEAAVSRALAMRFVERVREIPTGGTGLRPVKSDLTPREWEVVDLVAKGLGTREIATELVLSEETVYTHIKHVYRKLDVHTREEAVAAVNSMRGP